ncbi:hypothetical protein Dimus_014697 [Dionaea muscipula]
MSVLNQLFNRGVLGAKCKTCLTLAISRIKLLQNRRDVQLKQMRKEIAQFLQTGQEAIARIRVEHVIREQNIWAAYEILEMFCEFVLARIPILESQRDCPTELQEAIASIIFAAPRCSDLPDLLQVKNLFATKYGKGFVSSVSELRPDSNVNRTIIEKLSVSTPSPELRLKLLKEIAREYGVAWDASQTEAELNKNHEDLLDGAKPGNYGGVVLKAPSPQPPLSSSLLEESHSLSPANANADASIRHVESANLTSNDSFSPKATKSSSHSTTTIGVGPVTGNRWETRHDSSDALERARAAIASADRASAAARAAAQLVNAAFGSSKLEAVGLAVKPQ